jgi:hypothetical protein
MMFIPCKAVQPDLTVTLTYTDPTLTPEPWLFATKKAPAKKAPPKKNPPKKSARKFD